ELPQMSAFFREAQDHTTEVVADIDHLLELYAAAVQVNLSLISVRQNDVIRKFSGWASVFAIPTVVFSLLDFLPELHWRWAYPLVILALLVVCALVYRRRSEEHTSELQSRENLVCRLLLEKKKKTQNCCILHS